MPILDLLCQIYWVMRINVCSRSIGTMVKLQDLKVSKDVPSGRGNIWLCLVASQEGHNLNQHLSDMRIAGGFQSSENGRGCCITLPVHQNTWFDFLCQGALWVPLCIQICQQILHEQIWPLCSTPTPCLPFIVNSLLLHCNRNLWDQVYITGRKLQWKNVSELGKKGKKKGLLTYGLPACNWTPSTQKSFSKMYLKAGMVEWQAYIMASTASNTHLLDWCEILLHIFLAQC